MATEQGEQYYQEWNAGRISCKQVCLRSGAGLLAKFFSRRVEETEEQKMLQVVLEEEAKQKEGYKDSCVDAGHDRPTSDNATGSLSAPTNWPSYTVLTAEEVIQIESQADTQESQHAMPSAHEDAGAFASHITAEENARELAFAIVAGDVPAEASSHGGHAGCLDDNTNNGPSPLHGEDVRGRPDVDGLPVAPTMAAEELPVSSPVLATTVPDVDGVSAANGVEGHEGEASAATRTTEGHSERNESSNSGPKQTDLKHWLV